MPPKGGTTNLRNFELSGNITMQRHRRPLPTAGGFLIRELRWMALGIMTLVVLFVLMSRLRDEAAARPTPEEPASAATIAKLPKPTGPTDEDEEEAEAAKEEFPALSDGTLNLGPEEMVPYNRLVSWVKSQSFALLWARAKKNVPYTYLFDDAQRRRGALVAFDVEVRLVRDVGKNDAGVPLHEAWATTQESGNHLYDFVVVDFPAKMPVGAGIREKARFAGYFLKVQGYEPAAAKPGQVPERSPLLIGRLDWQPTPAAPEPVVSRDSVWMTAILAVLLLLWGLRFLFWKHKKTSTVKNTLTPPADGVIPIEAWLEQCNHAPEDERKPEEPW